MAEMTYNIIDKYRPVVVQSDSGARHNSCSSSDNKIRPEYAVNNKVRKHKETRSPQPCSINPQGEITGNAPQWGD